MDCQKLTLTSGKVKPYGASITPKGINFSIVSKKAKKVSLIVFKSPNDLYQKIELDPQIHKTGYIWHIHIQGLPSSFYYLYEVDGHLIVDPYAKNIYTTSEWDQNISYFPLAGFDKENEFDWQGDHPPSIQSENLIIYEMHIRSFTQHASSQSKYPGTYLGVIEKIPHLLDLGINAIELLPIYEFNECENHHINPINGKKLYNYWGYSTVNFFSPMQRYASKDELNAAKNEFKTMVKELHKHNIEVILDVVYNHTSEGNELGPNYCFKSLDKEIYYLMDDHDKFLNYSGCGNTFSANHPITEELILESLRYWVTEMHVDGFRFDLASILTRGTKGQPLAFAPILERINYDPILANVKLIAEPWDAGGLYQVGSFYPLKESRFSEWNGRYRDVVRKFIKGNSPKGEFVTNICGSQDLYYNRSPNASINYVIAHDGVTLNDLVSYQSKHNLENGENNRDGSNNENTWNCGVEGPTEDPKILKLREKLIKNYHLALMVSRGIPMIHMGDEYRHTKKGNNNTWCQDNELNWFLWDELEKNKKFYHFYKSLVHFRASHPILKQNHFLTDREIEWHGYTPKNPIWDKQDRLVAFTYKDLEQGKDLYIAFNSFHYSVTLQLPNPKEGFKWQWIANTANDFPNDYLEEKKVYLENLKLELPSYSAIILKAMKK